MLGDNFKCTFFLIEGVLSEMIISPNKSTIASESKYFNKINDIKRSTIKGKFAVFCQSNRAKKDSILNMKKNFILKKILKIEKR